MQADIREKIKKEIESKIDSSPSYYKTLSFFNSLSDEECFEFLKRSGIIDESGTLKELQKWSDNANRN